jgi:hypothetical protein
VSSEEGMHPDERSILISTGRPSGEGTFDESPGSGSAETNTH